MESPSLSPEASDADPPTATLAGQQLGPYTLERLIGQGGMGTVWLGHRNDGHYEGSAAIKLLNTALVGHPSARRFVREGTVLARLRHPNIAHLQDAGVSDSGQPYLVLEYIEGERLDLYCQRQALGLRQRIELFLAVLDAVAHAHSNLIVHRDLKPSNILVTARGTVKLLDFGVAALLSSDDGEGNRLTSLGSAGLTPGYAAPEQLCDGPVTTATDVYALGVLLFVLLTDRHPFEGEGLSNAELMRRALEVEMPLASTRTADLRQRRLLSGDLDNIIAMAVAHNPAERYATVELLAQDLRRYLAHEPVRARPASLRYRAGKFLRRNRLAVTVGMLFAGTLIGGIVVTTWQMLEVREQRDEARFQVRRYNSSVEFLWALLRADGGPDRPNLTPAQRVQRGAEILEKYAVADPEFAATMLLQLQRPDVRDADPAAAIKIFERAYELGQQAGAAGVMAGAQCSIIDMNENLGRTGDSQRRLTLAKQALGADYPTWSLETGCQLVEAKIASRLGNFASAVALLRAALTEIKAGELPCDSCYPSVLSRLQNVYWQHGRIKEALEIALQIEPAFKAAGFGDTVSTLTCQHDVAALLLAAGEVRQSLAQRELVNAQLAKFVPAGPPRVPYLVNHALVLLRMGRGEEVRQVLGDAPERARGAGDDRAYVQLQILQAAAAVLAGEWAAARAMLDRVAPVVRGEAGSPAWRSRLELLRAQTERGTHSLPAARQHIDAALALAQYGGARPDPVLPQVLMEASIIAHAQGADADAQRFARDALRMSEANARDPNASADVGESLLRLAQSHAAVGDPAMAQSLLRRAVQCLTRALGAEHPLTQEARQLQAAASLPSH